MEARYRSRLKHEDERDDDAPTREGAPGKRPRSTVAAAGRPTGAPRGSAAEAMPARPAPDLSYRGLFGAELAGGGEAAATDSDRDGAGEEPASSEAPGGAAGDSAYEGDAVATASRRKLKTSKKSKKATRLERLFARLRQAIEKIIDRLPKSWRRKIDIALKVASTIAGIIELLGPLLGPIGGLIKGVIKAGLAEVRQFIGGVRRKMGQAKRKVGDGLKRAVRKADDLRKRIQSIL